MYVIDRIEAKLSQLMSLVSEDEYVQFIENDKLLKIYDLAMDLDTNILTDEALQKIFDLIESKINSSK
jgi:hypothetical protein